VNISGSLKKPAVPPSGDSGSITPPSTGDAGLAAEAGANAGAWLAAAMLLSATGLVAARARR
jgi:hypothetical protein